MIAAAHTSEPTHLVPEWEAGDADQLQFVDATPVIVKHGGLRFLVVASYLTVGVGLQGNQSKLQQLAAIVTAYKLPWVIIGDWNCDPAELAQDEWLAYTKGVVLSPGGITCTSSEKGSLLDFAVCHPMLEPWLRVDTVHGVPW